MSFKNSLALSSCIVALASTACGARQAIPLTAATTVTCPGGTIRSAADAANYSACNIVQGDLTVAAADLNDLHPLSRLHQVTGTLRVSDCPALDDLSGLENLSHVGALEIHNDSDLDDLSGLGSLHSAGRVEVTDNAELANLNGLQGLGAIGRLVVRNNAHLYTAAGLSQLHEVGDLIVVNNRRLNSLTALRSLERARFVEIRENPVLCGTRLLPELKHVKASLVLHGNRSISQNEVRALLDRSGVTRNYAFALAEGRTLEASR